MQKPLCFLPLQWEGAAFREAVSRAIEGTDGKSPEGHGAIAKFAFLPSLAALDPAPEAQEPPTMGRDELLQRYAGSDGGSGPCGRRAEVRNAFFARARAMRRRDACLGRPAIPGGSRASK